MRKRYIDCIFFIFFFGCNEQSAQFAELYVSRDSIDLGSVYLQDTIGIEYSLKNNGNAPLQILSTGASCGCSKIFLADSIINPGQQSILMVRFYTTDTGNINKYIVIETNCKPIYKTLSFYGYLKAPNSQ